MQSHSDAAECYPRRSREAHQWQKVQSRQRHARNIQSELFARSPPFLSAQRELLKEAKKKKLEELQPEDGPDVSLFADALSDSLEFDVAHNTVMSCGSLLKLSLS